ncbi:MAG: hypothetical protein JWN33_173 [Candidatus Saccharibacteria bacterium]|nr:hypothetical protein [Candidatus Saccharibacteria bacterium]
MKRVILLHGNGGGKGSDNWFPYIQNAMEELGPKAIMNRLGGAAFIDYLLFDALHGTGTRLDTDALRPFIDSAYESTESFQTGIAIAGGLNAEVVTEDLPALLKDYPNLSWDAEGQLHPVDAQGKRPLDIEKARAYLYASASILPAPTHEPLSTQRAIFASEFYWYGSLQKRAPFPYD